MAACYAVENSLGNQADPTDDARKHRNIVLQFEFLMSHILHFYTLSALDYVQGPGTTFGGQILGPVAGLPNQSGPWTPDYNTGYYFDSGGGFAGIPPNTKLQRTDAIGVWDEVILDYVIALQVHRRCMEAAAAFSGRWPMYSNLVCGGVTNPNMDSTALTAALDFAKGVLYKGIANAPDFEGGQQSGSGGRGSAYAEAEPEQGTVLHFIKMHYIPTVQIVATLYSNYDNSRNNGVQKADGTWGAVTAGQGYGAGCGNLLSYGVFHTSTTPNAVGHCPHLLKTGVALTTPGADPSAPIAVTKYYDVPEDPMGIVKDHVKEYVAHSWYLDDGDHPRKPNEGYTKPDRDKVAGLSQIKPYSWVKSPRLVDIPSATNVKVAEVGPLARMVNNATYDVTGAVTIPWVSSMCPNRPVLEVVRGICAGAQGNLQHGGLSTMDRHRARALEAQLIANDLATTLKTAPPGTNTMASWTIPPGGEKEGWGTNEAPRGALLHYIKYKDNRITKYQCVVPTTWNASPRDGQSMPHEGPIEWAIDTPTINLHLRNLASGGQNVDVEVCRVVHAFDACIACAVHKVDAKKAKGKESKAKKLNKKKEVIGR